MKGYERCRTHAGLVGGYLWRHGTEEQQRARVADMQANRALWVERRKASGLPMPMGRKAGDDYYTPATLAHLAKRYPGSIGWRVKAARVGKLPASMAVIDPEEAEARLLWSLPNSAALDLILVRLHPNDGLTWYTPRRIADLARRFPGPDRKWRKKLWKLQENAKSCVTDRKSD